MFNPLLLLGAIASFSNSPNAAFESVISHSVGDEAAFAASSGIDSWGDYENYVERNVMTLAGQNQTGSWSDFEAISDISATLAERYPNYVWLRNDALCKETSDVSNCKPIEMKKDYYKDDELRRAIVLAGVQDKTDYGGCGQAI